MSLPPSIFPESDRRAAAMVLALAAALLLLLLAPALTGIAVPAFRDLMQNYGPMKAAFWRGGGGPLLTWNAPQFEGSSALADVVQQPFYLPNILFRLLRLPVVPGLTWYVSLHAMFGAWGMYLLARRISAARFAAAAAVIALLAGYPLFNLANVQFACACAWAPWVLLATDRFALAPSPRRFALLAACAPQPLLAGDPQELITLAAVSIALFAFRGRPLHRRKMLAFAAAGAVAAVIASPQIYATVRALPGYARESSLTEEVRGQWSFGPERIPELWVPRLYGSLYADGYWAKVRAWKRPYIQSAYVGVLFPVLAVLAARRRKRAALALLGGMVFAGWAALGEHAGLNSWLGHLVPTWRLYRYPERLMLVPTLCAALLSALGLSALAELPRPRRIAAVGLAGVYSLLTLFAIAAASPSGPLQAGASRAQVFASARRIGMGAGAAMVASAATAPPAAALFLGLAVAADLGFAAEDPVGQLPRDLFAAPPAACAALERAAAGASKASFRVFVEETALEKRGIAPGLELELPSWARQRVSEYAWGKRNLLETCGLRDAVALTSLEPLAEMSVWRAAGPIRALRAFATRFAVTPFGSALEGAGRVLERDPAHGYEIIELDEPLPRLYRPRAVIRGNPNELLTSLGTGSSLLTESVAALEADPREHQVADGRVLQFEDLGARQRWVVEHAATGYWVIADALDGDWSASIDGLPAPLIRADLMHRAIWLPPGRHEVRLAHRPVLALSLFALSLALLAALGFVALWSRVLRSRHAVPT